MKVVGAADWVVEVVADVAMLLDDVETILDDEVEEDDEVLEEGEVVLVLVIGVDGLEVVTDVELVVEIVEGVEVVFAESATYPPTARIMMITTTTITITVLEAPLFRFFILGCLTAGHFGGSKKHLQNIVREDYIVV